MKTFLSILFILVVCAVVIVLTVVGVNNDTIDGSPTSIGVQ